jgi:hypothetical protein
MIIFTTCTGSISIPMNTQGFMTGGGKHCTESEGAGMKEYIERAQLLKNLGYDETRRADVLPGSTFDIVLKEPAADVAEVRHGRWEFLGPNRLIKSCMCGTCSVCHVRSVYIVNTAICPNCGAPMDKEDEHEAN